MSSKFKGIFLPAVRNLKLFLFPLPVAVVIQMMIKKNSEIIKSKKRKMEGIQKIIVSKCSKRNPFLFSFFLFIS
jgi:hypothetical protein